MVRVMLRRVVLLPCAIRSVWFMRRVILSHSPVSLLDEKHAGSGGYSLRCGTLLTVRDMMRKQLFPVHNPEWEIPGISFLGKTPEESDGFQTPTQSGINSAKPGRNNQVFLPFRTSEGGIFLFGNVGFRPVLRRGWDIPLRTVNSAHR